MKLLHGFTVVIFRPKVLSLLYLSIIQKIIIIFSLVFPPFYFFRYHNSSIQYIINLNNIIIRTLIHKYNHSAYFGRFFLNLYFVHFSASGRSSRSRTTFGSKSPNLSVPEIVTFYFFTSCRSLTFWQIYTQHPVLESFIMGCYGSYSGVTLYIGLLSPSKISHLYLAL